MNWARSTRRSIHGLMLLLALTFSLGNALHGVVELAQRITGDAGAGQPHGCRHHGCPFHATRSAESSPALTARSHSSLAVAQDNSSGAVMQSNRSADATDGLVDGNDDCPICHGLAHAFVPALVAALPLKLSLAPPISFAWESAPRATLARTHDSRGPPRV